MKNNKVRPQCTTDLGNTVLVPSAGIEPTTAP